MNVLKLPEEDYKRLKTYISMYAELEEIIPKYMEDCKAAFKIDFDPLFCMGDMYYWFDDSKNEVLTTDNLENSLYKPFTEILNSLEIDYNAFQETR